MKILIAHNAYQQPGGEDRVVQLESELLEKHGHEVARLSTTNDEIQGLAATVKVALTAPYSHAAKRQCLKVINGFNPDVLHVHNLFPLLTPSILDAAAERHVPVVMTLHNYRLLCPGALLMRDGQICTECMSSTPYHAAVHRCYRGSFLGSLAAARVVAAHRRRDTWAKRVDCFIALTQFAKEMFIAAGLPEERIIVKPNFCSDPGIPDEGPRKGAIFVGRLAPEKGLRTLLTAWSDVKRQLHIIGSGPAQVAEPVPKGVTMTGPLSAGEIVTEMRRAQFLVMPSECFESFPMVIAEAFSNGLPVLASRLGAMANIVQEGVTGLLFEPGDPLQLAEKAIWLFDHPEECRRMGSNARAEYERRYTPETNYGLLKDAYQTAIAQRTAQP